MAFPSKYLSNFRRTLEIPLINFQIKLISTWSAKYVISNSAGAETFAITDANLYLKSLRIWITWLTRVFKEPRNFVLLFEGNVVRTRHTKYFPPNLWKHQKNCNRSRGWLQDWLLAWLSIVQADYNRSEQQQALDFDPKAI